MPLIIPQNLIGEDILEQEKIFTMEEERANSQDIRPINIAIVNLMPKKEETEVQILRMLTNSALQIKIDLIRMNSYEGKNTSINHLQKFYKTYDEIKNNKYDAMIVTGAPVETLAYEDIKYWEELKEIFDFAKTNVYSTMFICWSAQAALHYYYGIKSKVTSEKIFGVFEYEVLQDSKLLKGFDDDFYVPHSRHSRVNYEDILKVKDLDVLAHRSDTGVSLATTKDNRFIFSFGHWEYDKDILEKEYLRDLSKGLNIALPKNYYKNDNPDNGIKVRWRSNGNLFFSNWLNYCVYQETPFYLNEIQKKKVSKFGGSSLSDADKFNKVKEIINSKKDTDVIVVSAPGKRNKDDIKVTDDLIEISKIRDDLNELEIVLKRLKKEIKLKENMISSYLDKVKLRFENIAEDLKVEQEFSRELNNVFLQIEKSSSRDFIISRGEYLNAKLMSLYLDYEFVDAKELIKFDYNGIVDTVRSVELIRKSIAKGKKVVIPGFYGSDENGNIKIFERGGSDYTGSIVASALNSEIYENWTDVDGVMTEDPNKNKNAKSFQHLTYDELDEIIESGAEVYQRDAIKPARDKNIKIKVLNTNNPDFEGTEISNI
ncbi:homoserine O-succinyltransferase [Peptoniphilus olsenii]|uniref:Homoserine O-acetyltransferase n=1 Tax=Peptoniphilus olsenii TaxID=411570 RepID=A0ABV2JBM1_9FIRM